MLDIGLTIWAWRRGWRARALLPIGITFFLLILMGAAGAFDTAAWLLLVLAEIGALIYMVARPPKKNQQVNASDPSSPVALVAGEALGRPVKAEPVTVIEPATVVVPVAKAKLVLPDNSEISIIEPVKPVGRNDFNKAVPPQDLKYISRKHLLIKSDGGKYYVEDQNSANSTKVNGIDIKGKGKQELRDGDRIDVADVAALTFKVCSAF